MPSKSDRKPSKRHADILRIVGSEGSCTIAELAERLGVSQESIRRDVRPLTQSEQLVKLHGAVCLPWHHDEAPIEKRMRENSKEKRAIARLASQQVMDGDSLMLDTGTTTSLLARELLARKNLTVVTNSSDIARTLATVNGNKVFMAGGALDGDNGGAFGSSAVDFMASFNVRYSFISIGAIDARNAAMDYRLEEADIARVVLRQGQTSTIVSDHTKFNRSGLIRVTGFDGFDRLITSAIPPDDISQQLAKFNVQLEIV